MSANKIAETSTSTGTGNLTLAGAWSIADSFVTGNRTFNSFYGLNHRFPYMIQDKLGNWEKGVGYLSGAAVLVRETVVDNSLATAALINFPAGEKLVMVPTDAGYDVLHKLYGDTSYAGSFFSFSNGTNVGLVANRLDLVPFLVKRPMLVTDVTINVVTPVASSKVRLGLYQLTGGNLTSYDFILFKEFGEVSTESTGVRSIPTTFGLTAGIYFAACVSNLAPSLIGAGNPSHDIGIAFSNLNTPSQGFRRVVAGSADALPTTLNRTSSDVNQNQACPRVKFIGRFL